MDTLSQYGFPGIAIAGLVTWILIMRKDHRKEMETRDALIQRIADRQDNNEKENRQMVEKTKDAIIGNTGILQGLKTLLENRK